MHELLKITETDPWCKVYHNSSIGTIYDFCNITANIHIDPVITK